MVYVWLGIAVFLAAVEVATAQLVSLWFVAGALASLVCATFLPENIIVQVIVFVVVSAVTLLATRPLVKKLRNSKKVPTNSDKYIGKIGVVTQEIDNLKATGAVDVDGRKWTARSLDDAVIACGEKVVVNEINGVKLMVSVNKK